MFAAFCRVSQESGGCFETLLSPVGPGCRTSNYREMLFRDFISSPFTSGFTRYGTFAFRRSLPNRYTPRVLLPFTRKKTAVPSAAFELRMVTSSTWFRTTASISVPSFAWRPENPCISRPFTSSTFSALSHLPDSGLSQLTSTSLSLRFLAQRTLIASTAFSIGDSGSWDNQSLTFSRLTFSSQLLGCPLMPLVPFPRAITLRMMTLRMDPAGGSFCRDVPSTSLRRLMLKWIGSPSPHQNQPWRVHSIVRLESTTSLT